MNKLGLKPSLEQRDFGQYYEVPIPSPQPLRPPGAQPPARQVQKIAGCPVTGQALLTSRRRSQLLVHLPSYSRDPDINSFCLSGPKQ